MALLIFVIPESPSWLIHKKLYSKADEALDWLSRDHEDFAMEIEHDLHNRMNKVLKHRISSPQQEPTCWNKFTQFMSRHRVLLIYKQRQCSTPLYKPLRDIDIFKNIDI